MRTLSLSKVLAVVLVVVSGSPGEVWALSESVGVCSADDWKNDTEGCKARMKKMNEKMDRESNNKCTEAEKDFNSARSKLRSACSEAGSVLNAVGKAIENGPNNSCEANIIRCNRCAGGDSLQSDIGCGDLADDSEDRNPLLFDGVTEALQGRSSIGTSADIEREVMTCIPRSAEGLSDLRKRTSESKKDFRRSQEEIQRAQNELVEIENENKAKENESKDREEEVSTKVKERITQLRRRFENAQTEIGKQITELQQKWDQAEVAVRNIQEQKLQAELAHSDAIRTLQTQCHASALKQVGDLRKEEFDAWKSNKLTKGGFNQTMTQVGAPSKQRYNAKAEEFFTDCINDRSFKMATSSADERKAAAFRSVENALTSLRKSQQEISNQARELQTKALNQARDRTVEDMKQENDALFQALTRIDRERDTMRSQGQAKYLQKKTAIDRLTINANEDRKDYDELLAEERIIRQAARTSRGGKEGSTDKAINAHQEAIDKANYLISACSCETDASLEKRDTKAKCEDACKFNGHHATDPSPYCDRYRRSKIENSSPAEALEEAPSRRSKPK